MKKLLIIIFLAPFFTSNLNAQTEIQKPVNKSFSKGSFVICGGYGFPYISTDLFNTVPYWYKSTNINGNQNMYLTKTVNSGIGPVYGKVEYGLTDFIGLQANFAYLNHKSSFTQVDTSKYPYQQSYSKKIFSYSAIVRVNFHFTSKKEKLDFFSGIGVGMRVANITYESKRIPSNKNYLDISETVTTQIPFGFDLTAGCRYYFTKNLGIYGEVGFAKTPFQAGLVFKF